PPPCFTNSSLIPLMYWFKTFIIACAFLALSYIGFALPGSSFNLVLSNAVNNCWTELFTLDFEVSKLLLIFLKASNIESGTFNASKASNTRYRMFIIRCIGISLPIAIFLFYNFTWINYTRG